MKKYNLSNIMNIVCKSSGPVYHQIFVLTIAGKSNCRSINVRQIFAADTGEI